jgi:hypothetical protein
VLVDYLAAYNLLPRSRGHQLSCAHSRSYSYCLWQLQYRRFNIERCDVGSNSPGMQPPTQRGAVGRLGERKEVGRSERFRM